LISHVLIPFAGTCISQCQHQQFKTRYRNFGRRGAALTTGTKTTVPVDYAKALSIFDKLVASKTSKGYTPGEDGTPYQGDATRQASGLLPQLLTVADDAEAAHLADHPEWAMQEKFDGRRMLLRKTGGAVEAINKLGLVVAVSGAIVDAVAALPGDATLDGEVIGDRYCTFDLLSREGTDLTAKPYRDRYAARAELISAPNGGPLSLAACWTAPAEKAAQLDALRGRNAEGAVFKHLDAPYTAGRPNSAGPQRKFKFVATCSAVVTAVNQKRSVAVSLLDGDEWRPVGNVTIPANRDVPTAGDVVEVRYLYVVEGGSLFQPVYLGVRDDIETGECVVGQLKLKAG
jgi:bifunctional non-homologous end joining protein LigD